MPIDSARPRHISTRPADEPVFTAPTGMDFEKRRLIFPPGFVDEIVLKGGDEYVKAEDLATIVNVVLGTVAPLLRRIEMHLSLVTDEEIKEDDTSED